MLFNEQLKKWDFKTTWTFVYLGLNFLEYEFALKREDVIKYACEIVAATDDNDEVLNLILSGDNTYEFNFVLKKLIEAENADFCFEQRKWIVFVLNNVFEKLTVNLSIEDLFLLDDLWSYFEYPENYPRLKEQGPYSSGNKNDLSKIFSSHIKWVENEKMKLCIEA